MSALTGIEENKLLELMDKMLKTRLIKEREVRGEGVCSFADILVRDVVYEEVSLLKRKKLHGVVGCALEKVYAKKIDEHFGELASHFLEGGEKDKALDYFLKAGDKAAKIFANREATSYFQSALRLLEEKEGELQQKKNVLERLGDTKRLVGEYDASIKYWNDALPLAKQLNEKETTARLHRKIANVFWSNLSDRERAKEHHEKALKILETEPESVELASLYEDMAGMVSMGATGNMTEALSLGEKAVELAKRLNAHEVLAHAYMPLGEILGWLGNNKKALECYDRALKIALDNGYMETAVWAYDDLAGWLPPEENERRLEYYQKAFELAKKVGTVEWTALIGEHLAYRYLGMGDVNKAVALAEESAALNRKSGNMTLLSWSLRQLGTIHQILGEWDKAEQYYKEALNISQRIDDFQSLASALGMYGWLYFDRGEYAKAKEFIEKGYEVIERHGAKSWQMGVSDFVAAEYIELGEFEKAQNLIDDLRKYALEKEDKNLIASADAATANLFRAQKKWEESIKHFEKSLQEFEALGERRWNMYWFAKLVLCEYARTYLERAQESDREKAHTLLDQALEIFQKMGAKKDVEKTMNLVEVLHSSPTQIPEKTAGPKSYQQAEVQCKIMATPEELKIGESLDLEIELTNTRKEGAILLTRITEVVPEGFVATKKLESYRIEGDCLNMKEKQLDPLKREEIRLVLTPKIQGTFYIKPKVVYLDENGQEKIYEPKPISITVKELGIKGWLKGER
jgi:tetratricopeptide (TPR) repeat protein